MGTGKSILAATVLENIEHCCKFDECDQKCAKEDLDIHEKACPHRNVVCPQNICKVRVPLSKLADHLVNSKKCCHQEFARHITNQDWSQVTFKTRDIFKTKANWGVQICSFSGQFFAVSIRRSERHFYFMVVMFATEVECSKFKFEMIIHNCDSEPSESDMTAVKFQGKPFSIDVNKRDLNLFCTSELLLNNLVKSSVNKIAFSVSYKLSKLEND